MSLVATRDEMSHWPRYLGDLWRPLLAILAGAAVALLGFMASFDASRNVDDANLIGFLVQAAAALLLLGFGLWAWWRDAAWADGVVLSGAAAAALTGFVVGSTPTHATAWPPVVVLYLTLLMPWAAHWRIGALLAMWLAAQALQDVLSATDAGAALVEIVAIMFLIGTWLAMDPKAPWRVVLSLFGFLAAVLQALVAVSLISDRPGTVLPEIVSAVLYLALGVLGLLPGLRSWHWSGLARPTPERATGAGA